MNLTRVLPVRILQRVFLLAAAGLIFQGCSRSTDKSSEEAALDVRGEPIDSSNSVSIQSEALPVVARVTNAPAGMPGAGANVPSPATVQSAQPEQTKAEAASADGFTPVTFEKLASFTFEIPDEQASTNKVASASKSEDQIPAAVKALNEKRVSLKGFMLPLKVESGLVTEMLIMRDQSMCCYGTVPKITEWVSIKMIDKGVKAIMDQPVTIFGKLRVGEIRENGYLVGIYQMEGEKLEGPVDL